MPRVAPSGANPSPTPPHHGSSCLLTGWRGVSPPKRSRIRGGEVAGNRARPLNGALEERAKGLTGMSRLGACPHPTRLISVNGCFGPLTPGSLPPRSRTALASVCARSAAGGRVSVTASPLLPRRFLVAYAGCRLSRRTTGGPIGGAGRRPARRDAGRASGSLCHRAGRVGECLDRRTHRAPAGPAAQKKSLIATDQRPDQRVAWQETVTVTERAVETLVFLDETSTQTVMTRRRGRAPRGIRVRERVPRNHGDNLTLISAIGVQGVQGVLAPLVFPRALACLMDHSSSTGCGRGWCRCCVPVRSWSWTTCRCTRPRRPGRRLRRPGAGGSSSRSIPPITTRLSWSSRG